MKLLPAAILPLLLAAQALACQVPVFRFALERWPADHFRLLVTSRGPLEAGLQADLDTLRESLAVKPPPINLDLDLVDLDSLSEIERVSLVGLDHAGTAPSMVLLAPESWKTSRPVWSGAATGANLASLLDSPARQRCANHLLDGETAVWLLVTSGDRVADAQARATLEAGLERAASTLDIPPGVIRREDLPAHRGRDLDLDDVLRSDLPLRISFEIETVARDDPAEALFLATLLGPSPPPPDETLIVPVFGRGRTPGPLPVSRLTAERVVAACEYLCGSCSCLVKQGNPGYDLLFRTAWEQRLAPAIISAESVLDVVTFDGDQPAAPSSNPAERPSMNVAIIGGATVAAVALLLLAAAVFRRSRGTGTAG